MNSSRVAEVVQLISVNETIGQRKCNTAKRLLGWRTREKVAIFKILDERALEHTGGHRKGVHTGRLLRPAR